MFVILHQMLHKYDLDNDTIWDVCDDDIDGDVDKESSRCCWWFGKYSLWNYKKLPTKYTESNNR